MEEPQNDNYRGQMVDANLVKDGKGKRYTSYVIRVTPPWFYHAAPYKICRRYREFNALYVGLVKTFGKKEINCDFPKKKLAKNKPTVVSHRQASLQAFLNNVSDHPRAGGHKLAQDFYTRRPDDPPLPKDGNGASASHARANTGLAAPTKKETPKNQVVAGKKNVAAAKAMAAAQIGTDATSRPTPSPVKPPAQQEDALNRSGLDGDHLADVNVEKKTDVNPVTARSMSKTPSVGENPFNVPFESNSPDGEDEPQKLSNPSSVGYIEVEPTDNATGDESSATPVQTSSPASTSPPPVVVTDPKLLESLPELSNLTRQELKKAEQCDKTGDFGGAIEHFSSVLSDIGDKESHVGWRVKVLLARSTCYLQTGQSRQCCMDCDIVLNINPNNANALVNRGKGFQEREKLRDSFNDFQAAVLLKDPSANLKAKKGLGEVTKMLNQTGDGEWVRKNRKI